MTFAPYSYMALDRKILWLLIWNEFHPFVGHWSPLLDTWVRMLVSRRSVFGTALDKKCALAYHSIYHAPLMESPPLCANVVHDIAPLTICSVCHEASRAVSRCWIVFHYGFYLLLVSLAISLEEVVGIGLRWRIGIWVVEKILDAEKDLFDGDGWLPALFFVQDWQANSTGGINIGVEKWGNEFACMLVRSLYLRAPIWSPTLRRLCRIL